MNFYLTFLFPLSFLLCTGRSSSDVYIVHLDLPKFAPLGFSDVENLDSWYRTFLPATISSSPDSSNLIHSYHNVFSGFAAKLTAGEVREMSKIPGFISAQVEEIVDLHTTHSPNFLGLNLNTGFWMDSGYGTGVIIGMLDTGVTADHPSFSDEGMSPPPAKWKGRCDLPSLFSCNNKLIGARYFTIGDGTAVDQDGHGTHTSSTAAGNFVAGANVFGNAIGTAAGIAPRAHIASYKVCSFQQCSESDILAAIDAAIEDGVDIISLSLGGPPKPFFYNENIAVAAFRATERGILVSASAGNTGPIPGTVQHGAPWMFTIGASTTDRKIRATAILGNSDELHGESTNQPSDYTSPELPVVFPGLTGNAAARYCLYFGNTTMQGKIVLCQEGFINRVTKGRNAKAAGAAGMILFNGQSQGYTTFSSNNVLPATHISFADGQKLIAYMNSTSNPTAKIFFRGTMIGDRSAPVVASYSSRGPNRPSIGILKPDIIGPGHNILAAWHQSVENNTNSNSNFNIISGTSMSCPHLTGAAALIKSAHPNWSPAAIKSALMTTADQLNLGGDQILQGETLNTANSFAVSSGHVNILRASDPGLIYDIEPDDYIRYLCGMNYTNLQVKIIANREVNCSAISSIPEAELNYPSFSVFVRNGDSQVYNRTFTNVGDANEVYIVRFSEFSAVDMRVEPNRLEFSEVNQRLSYQVRFSRKENAQSGAILHGSITWASSRHIVRSPAVVFVM